MFRVCRMSAVGSAESATRSAAFPGEALLPAIELLARGLRLQPVVHPDGQDNQEPDGHDDSERLVVAHCLGGRLSAAATAIRTWPPSAARRSVRRSSP